MLSGSLNRLRRKFGCLICLKPSRYTKSQMACDTSPARRRVPSRHRSGSGLGLFVHSTSIDNQAQLHAATCTTSPAMAGLTLLNPFKPTPWILLGQADWAWGRWCSRCSGRGRCIWRFRVRYFCLACPLPGPIKTVRQLCTSHCHAHACGSQSGTPFALLPRIRTSTPFAFSAQIFSKK